jgi:hypothetical protein
MRDLIICNACHILTDAEVQAVVAPLQKQIDRDFLPAWHAHGVEPVKVSFATIKDIPSLPPDCWPIFLNKHSLDEGALGWHDDDAMQNIHVYSRVFVGDCIRYGLNWQVTVSHEALEILLDPDIRRVFGIRSGLYAAVEACDAVESDDLAYDIDGVKVSDFVLPAYFSHSATGPFDHGGHLHAPCPALTPGGYMSLRDLSGWHQVFADKADGLPGRRALSRGFRRQERLDRPVIDLELVDFGEPSGADD